MLRPVVVWPIVRVAFHFFAGQHLRRFGLDIFLRTGYSLLHGFNLAKKWGRRPRIYRGDSEKLSFLSFFAHAKLTQDEVRRRARQTEETEEMLVTYSNPKAMHYSSTPIQNLTPITISSMRLMNIHRGRYMLCRTISSPWRSIVLQTLAEDTEGNAFVLLLDSFPTASNASVAGLGRLLPVGTVLAIREPNINAVQRRRYAFIHVKSPTDVVFVEQNSDILCGVTWHPRLGAIESDVEAASIPQEGAKDDAHWLADAFAYTRSLGTSPESDARLRLKRAEAYLNLKFFSGALADALYVRHLTSPITSTLRDEALLTEAKAEYGRRNYTSAKQKFVEWQQMHPNDESVISWISRSQRRFEESQLGNYNWAGMFRDSKNDPRLDVADYMGPMEVRFVDNQRGWGTIATRDIKPGELLLVSKAFDYFTTKDETDGLQHLEMHISPSNRFTAAYQSARLDLLVRKIYGNPGLYDSILKLYAESGDPISPIQSPVPLYDQTPINPLAPGVNIDVARLQTVLMSNSFGMMPLDTVAKEVGSPEEVIEEAASWTTLADILEVPTGFHLLRSLFNHSCGANSRYSSIGDVMVVRAIAPIKAGTEITLSYFNSYMPYDLRRHILSRRYQLDCNCWKCKQDRDESRWNVFTKTVLLMIISSHDKRGDPLPLHSLREIEETMSSFSKTTKSPVRPEMFFIRSYIANRLQSTLASREAIKQYTKALGDLGFVVIRSDSGPSRSQSSTNKKPKPTLPIRTHYRHSLAPMEWTVPVMLRISQQYFRLNDQHNSSQWLKAALWLFDTTIGGGKELFMLTWDGILTDYGLHKLAQSAL